jgi:hypothetical protein
MTSQMTLALAGSGEGSRGDSKGTELRRCSCIVLQTASQRARWRGRDEEGSRIEREKLAADRKGHGEGEGSSDSEGLKVNGLRGFERSTPSRGIASSAGSEQPSNSGYRGLDRGKRPSCSNESVRSKKLVAAEQ